MIEKMYNFFSHLRRQNLVPHHRMNKAGGLPSSRDTDPCCPDARSQDGLIEMTHDQLCWE